MSISAFVADLLGRHPGGQPYLTLGRERMSRAELAGEIRAEAALFAALGVRPGSTVAMQAPPSFTQVVALLALWHLDAQVQLLDHRLKPAEVATLHAMCRPQFTVRATTAGRTLLTAAARHELVTEARPGGRAATTGHRLVQFSSGSTGTPKAVGRTTASLRAEVDRFATLTLMPGPGDRVLLLSSTVHSFGLIAGLLHSLHSGAEVVFTPRVSAREILATAERHRVGAVFGVPFHFDLIGGGGPPLPGLRVAVSGGEIMPGDVAARFAGRFGVRIGESYGTTETGVIAMDAGGGLRPAVGPPMPGITVRIRDGELDVRLPESPYLHGADAGRYADGWFRTRDRAALDPGGAVRLFGRADSLVVVGGLKIDLAEVEATLRTHPEVDDAVLVHVDAIEAFVAARTGTLTAADLLRWARERLADHKLPRLIHVLPALPRTANGKLIREPATLRAAAA